MKNNINMILKIIYLFFIILLSQSSTAQNNDKLNGIYTVIHIDTAQIMEQYNYIKVIDEKNCDTLNVLVKPEDSVLIDTLIKGSNYQLELQKMTSIKTKDNHFIRLNKISFYKNDDLIFKSKNNTYRLLTIKSP